MRDVVAELSLVPSTIVKPHLTESFHPSTSELSLVLGPVSPSAHQPAFALVVIVLPLPLVHQVAVRIDQLPIALHFSLDPISEEMAAVVIDVFSFTVPQCVSFFSLVAIPIGIDFAGFNYRTIL